jgi:hypothetical protein
MQFGFVQAKQGKKTAATKAEASIRTAACHTPKG